MVFGLIGLLFNVVTFPGMLVNGIVQEWFDERYGVPTTTLAIDEDINLEESEESLLEAARVLDPGEEPTEDEQVELLINYEAVDNYSNLFTIILSPLVVTTIIGGVFFAITAWLLASGVQTWDDRLWLIPFWLGFSIAAHAFPNQRPTDALWRESGQTSSPLRILGYPIVGLSKLFNALEFLWIDAIYAIAVWYVIGVLLGVYPN